MNCVPWAMSLALLLQVQLSQGAAAAAPKVGDAQEPVTFRELGITISEQDDDTLTVEVHQERSARRYLHCNVIRHLAKFTTEDVIPATWDEFHTQAKITKQDNAMWVRIVCEYNAVGNALLWQTQNFVLPAKGGVQDPDRARERADERAGQYQFNAPHWRDLPVGVAGENEDTLSIDVQQLRSWRNHSDCYVFQAGMQAPFNPDLAMTATVSDLRVVIDKLYQPATAVIACVDERGRWVVTSAAVEVPARGPMQQGRPWGHRPGKLVEPVRFTKLEFTVDDDVNNDTLGIAVHQTRSARNHMYCKVIAADAHWRTQDTIPAQWAEYSTHVVVDKQAAPVAVRIVCIYAAVYAYYWQTEQFLLPARGPLQTTWQVYQAIRTQEGLFPEPRANANMQIRVDNEDEQTLTVSTTHGWVGGRCSVFRVGGTNTDLAIPATFTDFQAVIEKQNQELQVEIVCARHRERRDLTSMRFQLPRRGPVQQGAPPRRLFD